MGGDGGGPHTHTQYSLTDHTHDAPDLTHDHSGVYQPAGDYADTTHTHPEYEGGTGGSYDDTEVRGLIQDNATAIEGKADDPHTHNEYQPVGDYATNTDLTNGLAGKSDTTHTHAEPTGFWKSWTGTQAEYDALGTYDDDTLYVVV